ncbi:hypothetical protein EG68_09423 [Paragonimus skrjabini miyazakii]|uniref:Peptidase M3A/M3B catalytic domain-containing protein n=1 Tax=Paragonimus skrjabini miyazakii TaxID=59628 RepID=A0A8S9YRN8_9TREM|nr:hypothetical protein EG68_09423 [Paragonimus skrjabini miyazakii]
MLSAFSVKCGRRHAAVVSTLVCRLRLSRHSSNYAHLSPLADAFNIAPSTVHCESSRSGSRAGLFGDSHLTTPHGFTELVAQANEQCRILLDEALSSDRTRKMVQVLDDMSDTLCRVADLADCVRMLHPDESFRQAASNACQAVGCLVEELNTIPALYTASLRASQTARSDNRLALSLPDARMDRIDRRVLDLFIADFQLSGVQLQDSHRRNEFIKTAAAALELGSQFMHNSHIPVIFNPADWLSDTNTHRVNPGPVQLTHPIIDEPDPELRAATYRAYYTALPGQEQCLTDLMTMRHRMAQAAGFDSFADRATQHSLAETPERVHLFLDRVCQLLTPLAANVTREHLLPAVRHSNRRSSSKLAQATSPDDGRIWPWDVNYALGLRRQALRVDDLVDYFSLGACMEGVSQLADCLFGLRLRVEPTEPGECWHPSVIKIGVYSTKRATVVMDRVYENDISPSPGENGLIGFVYCDLLDRPGKPAQDCHYTIRGGRRLSDGSYQNPIITLQLTVSAVHSPPLLSLGQVENLFHEWGHALHSMLARTRYQHVTGTRCSTDLAELPSTLFEQFALDPRVAMEYARHWSTGKSPGNQELSALGRLSVGGGFGNSVELIQQSTYAKLDQVLHSGPPELTLLLHKPTGQADRLPASSHLLSQIQHESGLSDWLVCSPTHLGAWVHRFTHLIGYGGRYYAYLMARAGAQLVWRQCFADDPWSSSKGQLYAERVLRHGGEFHPASILGNLLADSPDHVGDFDHQLSPEKLAHGLADHAEECENLASTLFAELYAPGLHQPDTTCGIEERISDL